MPRKKSKVAKLILRRLLITGAVIIAASSPYFWIDFYGKFFKGKPILKKKTRDTFYNLKRRGLIRIEKKNKNIYMFLTKKGEVEAGKYQINEMYIKKAKKWDKKWRLIIFDIPESHRIKRDLFRGKLKELGFYQLQKSVWVYPYSCQKEINLLREFFGLEKRNLMVLKVEKMENDEFLRKLFRLQNYRGTSINGTSINRGRV